MTAPAWIAQVGAGAVGALAMAFAAVVGYRSNILTTQSSEHIAVLNRLKDLDARCDNFAQQIFGKDMELIQATKDKDAANRRADSLAERMDRIFLAFDEFIRRSKSLSPSDKAELKAIYRPECVTEDRESQERKVYELP